MSSGLVPSYVGTDGDGVTIYKWEGVDEFTYSAPDISYSPGRVQILPEWQNDGMVTPWVDPAWFDTQAGRDYIAAQGFPMMASKLGIPLSQFLTDPRGNHERFNQLFPQTYSVFADVISSPVTKMFLIPFAPAISEFVTPFVQDLIPSFATDLFSVPVSPLDFVSPGSEAIMPIAESVASVAEPVLETALQTVSTVAEGVPVDDVLDLFDLSDTPAWNGYDYVDEFGDPIGAGPVLDETPFNPYASEAGYTGSYAPESSDIVGPPAPSPVTSYPVTPYPMPLPGALPAPGALPSITNIPAPIVATGAGLPSLPTLANLFKSIFSPSPASAATMPIRYPAGTVLRPGATTPTGARPLAPFNLNTSELTKFALPAAIVIGGLYFISRKKKGA